MQQFTSHTFAKFPVELVLFTHQYSTQFLSSPPPSWKQASLHGRFTQERSWVFASFEAKTQASLRQAHQKLDSRNSLFSHFGIEIGLYRDDGLAVFNQTSREIERAKKELCQIFARNNLKITIEANKKVVNFLDVTLDLNTGKFKPYTKPLSTPLYVHSQSNHPPNIIRNIPAAINRRLSSISSDQAVFNEVAPPYQEALRKSGYTHQLEFKPPPQGPAPQKRMRRRNVIWFNPPYNKNVKTNIGRAFISLINRSFPADHKLRKIFNRNTLKLSYGCMPNVKQLIDGHNKAILNNNGIAEPRQDEEKKCNCKKKECPLECLVNEVVYQATVKTKDTKETYIGFTV